MTRESIATLILSGRFLGFLPDHYAEAVWPTGRMQAVQPDQFHYECKFVSMVRRLPPLAGHQAFQDCPGPWSVPSRLPAPDRVADNQV